MNKTVVNTLLDILKSSSKILVFCTLCTMPFMHAMENGSNVVGVQKPVSIIVNIIAGPPTIE